MGRLIPLGEGARRLDRRRDAEALALGLCECVGFRVVTPTGRLGVVEDVVFRTRLDRPDALLVRAGILARRRLHVPVELVDAVLPSGRRVLLAADPRRAA